MADVYGRAIRDWYRDDLDAPLLARDGERTREHPIEQFYFTPVDPADPFRQWWDEQLAGPLLDVGAGAGTDALHWQERHETVAVDVSAHLVGVMRDRGVRDARQADMFALAEHVDPDRFRSVTARGTQLGLARSREGLASFLSDLAGVTTPGATAVLDAYDPARAEAEDLLGFRADPAPGLAYRSYHFEYGDEVGETLLFRLFAPDRVRAAADGTPWTVRAVRHPTDGEHGYYAMALEKN